MKRLVLCLWVTLLFTSTVPAYARLDSSISAGPQLSEESRLSVPDRPVPAPTDSPSPGSSASPTPTPTEPTDPEASPSPTPEGPQITLVNPSPGYAGGQRPIVSDSYDGIDDAYTLTAVVENAPPQALVEAELVSFVPVVPVTEPEVSPPPPAPSPGPIGPSVRRESEIGILTEVQPGMWELPWEIPDSVADGRATIEVRLYEFTFDGYVERAQDQVDVNIQHRPRSTPEDEEEPYPAAQLTWPGQNGEVGFYRASSRDLLSPGGAWVTVVDGTMSGNSFFVDLMYSVDPLSERPDYFSCGSASTTSTQEDGSQTFRGTCALKHLPSEVTSVAAIPSSGRGGAASVHRVTSFLQSAHEMSLSLRPQSSRRGLPMQCVPFVGEVRDRNGRPVPNVNVDIEFQGTSDAGGFGTDSFQSVFSLSPTYVADGSAPNSGGHGRRFRPVCGAEAGEPSTLPEGVHREVGLPDRYHAEFQSGGFGDFTFQVYSPGEGIGRLNAWVDDSVLRSDTVERLPDDDLQNEDEPPASSRVFWYLEAPTIKIAQPTEAGKPGSCSPFAVKVQAGTEGVEDLNVDVHLSSESGQPSFCAVDGRSTRAPDGGEHEDGDQAGSHAGSSMLHTEGETDPEGNLVFGVVSSESVPVKVQAWIDGELESDGSGVDNDVQDEPESSAQVTYGWASRPEEARVRLVSPAGLGGNGPTMSSKFDRDTSYRIVAEIDSSDRPENLFVESAPADTKAFVDVGQAAHIGAGSYELAWDTSSLSAGSYIVRVSVPGGTPVERSVTIDNAQETASISAPGPGSTVPFDNDVARVDGTASGGADRVDVFYSTARTSDRSSAESWEPCGSVSLAEASDGGPQGFSSACTLSGDDRPSEVTGLGTLAFATVCAPTGCEDQPQSGDVISTRGVVANPVLTLEPPEAQAQVGSCKEFTLQATDPKGATLSDLPVDVRIDSGSGDVEFCEPRAGGNEGDGESGQSDQTSEAGSAPDEGEPTPDDPRHLEGNTDVGGLFTFGITSIDRGQSRITAWADQVEDDTQAFDEPFDVSLMNWTLPNNCTQVGTPDDDVLVGGRGHDKLCGLGGDDILRGLGGEDELVGGNGDDLLIGADGADLLSGGGGEDELQGGGGYDSCYGGSGRNEVLTCEGGDGAGQRSRPGPQP